MINLISFRHSQCKIWRKNKGRWGLGGRCFAARTPKFSRQTYKYI